MTVSGSQQVVGCTYKLAIVDAPQPSDATFFDNGQQVGSDSSGSGMFNNGISVSWTPKTAGAHTITASMGYLSASIFVTPVTVQVAAATGSGNCGLNSLFPSISG